MPDIAIVEISHSTVMWNEGFEKAGRPFAILATDDIRWANSLKPSYGDWQSAEFSIEVTILPDTYALPLLAKKQQIAIDDVGWYDNDNIDIRYPKQVLSASTNLDKAFNDAMDEFTGI